jgi:phage-related minor tail protein
MSRITNDHALRDALNALNTDQQRILGARFAEHVMHLSHDERVRRAIATGLSDQSGPAELEDAYKAAKAYATKTYTACGKDTDWLAQADHFVAAATAAALTPESALTEKQNPAWKAAMQARMAVNCTLVELDDPPEVSEAEHQYALANAFLS